MTQVVPFKFDKQDVRVVQDGSGEPQFVGSDVCAALGYANATDAMKRHCRGVVKRYPIVDALGRSQEVRVLGEGDVMRLMVHSKLPSAQEFERLVFEEILPAIRRTGSYAAKPVKPASEAAPVSSDWLEQSTRNAQSLIDLVSKRIGMDEAVKDMPTKISVPDLAMGLAGLLMKRERFLLEFWDVQNPTLRRLHSKEVLVETQSPDWADQLMKRLTSEQTAQIMHAAARRMAG